MSTEADGMVWHSTENDAVDTLPKYLFFAKGHLLTFSPLCLCPLLPVIPKAEVSTEEGHYTNEEACRPFVLSG
jgi:hypothetical protein